MAADGRWPMASSDLANCPTDTLGIAASGASSLLCGSQVEGWGNGTWKLKGKGKGRVKMRHGKGMGEVSLIFVTSTPKISRKYHD